MQDPQVPLGGWLENGFIARDLERKHWTGVDSQDLVRAAIDRLEECKWIRPRKTDHSPAGGRPTIRYEINPAIRAKRGRK
jgi:hypothetical protein